MKDNMKIITLALLTMSLGLFVTLMNMKNVDKTETINISNFKEEDKYIMHNKTIYRSGDFSYLNDEKYLGEKLETIEGFEKHKFKVLNKFIYKDNYTHNLTNADVYKVQSTEDILVYYERESGEYAVMFKDYGDYIKKSSPKMLEGEYLNITIYNEYDDKIFENEDYLIFSALKDVTDNVADYTGFNRTPYYLNINYGIYSRSMQLINIIDTPLMLVHDDLNNKIFEIKSPIPYL